jgi:tRNA (Thr-GGU) A37 N-methylase
VAAEPHRPVGRRLRGFEAPDTLKIRYLDCIDGTPLLDVKPYLPTTDREPNATIGWLDPHPTRNSNTDPT